MFWNRKEDLIKYAEHEARINASFHLECTNALERSGATLLNILLGGAGGGLALFVSLYEKGAADWLLVGTAMTSVYMFIVCGILIWGCFWVRDVHPPANEPKNIYNKNTLEYSLLDIKGFNLERIQEGIERNVNRNALTGSWLDRVRILSALTPVIILISYLFS